jgi:hypothetical protein
MGTTSWAIPAILILLVTLSGWEAIPLLVLALNPGSMRYWFDDSQTGQELISKSPTLQAWLLQLQALGFFPLGIKAEKLPLWGGVYREAALVSRETDIYASIVLHRNGDPASLYFYTPLRGGGMVFTRNHSFAPEAESDGLSVRNVPTHDFKEALASHSERLLNLTEKGFLPIVGSSQQTRIEATRAFYVSAYARRPSQYLLSPVILSFFLWIVLALVVGSLYVLTPR